MIYKTLIPLINEYDSFLIDVYGVLYDGRDFYKGVPELLEKIIKAGKRVVILSNTTLVSSVCQTKYEAKGVIKGIHYNEFLSSGEVFKRTMQDSLVGFQTYIQIFNKNYEIFESSGLTEIDTIQNADFVYVGDLNNETVYYVDNLKTKSGNPISIENILKTSINDVDEFNNLIEVFEKCLKYKKPFVIVNPDIFATESINGSRKTILCQGAIGEFYENLGGKVIYFGKPHKAIYDYAKQHLDGCHKTAMIGDTTWTDILGGNAAGFDTILTLSGVAGRFINNMNSNSSTSNLSIEDKLNKLLIEIAPKMTQKKLLSSSQLPTYVIEKFA
ncbi:MAG: TIGR01459 family HAD-type hydrolase [Holosporales bacterium]|jgi:HAD superfamily hydrolase (TIGR01459 family)|nr:TIGR01459 family HAD-type hydrolase [Holosporales bacterium]